MYLYKIHELFVKVHLNTKLLDPLANQRYNMLKYRKMLQSNGFTLYVCILWKKLWYFLKTAAGIIVFHWNMRVICAYIGIWTRYAIRIYFKNMIILYSVVYYSSLNLYGMSVVVIQKLFQFCVYFIPSDSGCTGTFTVEVQTYRLKISYGKQ